MSTEQIKLCEFCKRDLSKVKLAQNQQVPWCGECEDDFNKRCREMDEEAKANEEKKEPEEKWRHCDRCTTTYSVLFSSCIRCGGRLHEVGELDFVKTPKKVKVGPGDIAKYPFLSEAREYIQGFDFEVLGKPENYHILQRATDRIKMSLNGQYDMALDNHTVELLTFVTELVMLKLVGLDKMSQKLALSEARRVEQFLTQDLKKDYNRMSDITQSLVLQILEHEFYLRVQMRSIIVSSKKRRKEESVPAKFFAIHIRDWTTHVSWFHEPEWKLINRQLAEGWVILDDAEELVRLVRNELYALILGRLKDMKIPERKELPEMLILASDYVKQEYLARFEKKFMVTGDIPPCVRHIADMLNRGENVSHQGRILLASYMGAIGKSVEEICEMFKHAPDYNEKITRQQVTFIADNKRLGRAYHVSNCEKLQSYNLCWPDAGCNGIKNPMQYWRKRK